MSREDAKQTIQNLINARGSITKVYSHWTAGRYTTPEDLYHVSILGPGGEYPDGTLYFTTDDMTEYIGHTYMRNTGAIGVSVCCCFDATVNSIDDFDLGSEPPTAQQLESMKQFMALCSMVLGLPLDIKHFMTHAEAADNLDGEHPCEPYGPLNTFEKWDLMKLQDFDGTWMIGGELLRKGATYYVNDEGFRSFVADICNELGVN